MSSRPPPPERAAYAPREPLPPPSASRGAHAAPYVRNDGGYVDDRRAGGSVPYSEREREGSRRRYPSPRRGDERRRDERSYGGERHSSAYDLDRGEPPRRNGGPPPRRSRSRSPPARDRRRDGNRERERERDYTGGSRGDRDRDVRRDAERTRDRERDRESRRRGEDDPEEGEASPARSAGADAGAANDEAADPGEEEMAMMAAMGFGGFGTTKGKKVKDNAEGAADIKKERTWRQYMNRKGGFNRPLDKI